MIHDLNLGFHGTYVYFYDIGDSRMNPFKEGGNDESQVGDLQGGHSKDDGSSLRSSNDILKGLNGPMTRARTRRMREALHRLILDSYEEALKLGSKDQTKQFINVIWAEQTLDEDFMGHTSVELEELNPIDGFLGLMDRQPIKV